MTAAQRRELIFATIEDCVSDLLYYDRKEDEDLPVGVIEEALDNKEITIEEMVEHFKLQLIDGLNYE